MIISVALWELFSTLIRIASMKGDVARGLRKQRRKLSSQNRRLQSAWIIPEEDLTIGDYIAKGTLKIQKLKFSNLVNYALY